MAEKKLNQVIWAPDPVRRKIEAGVLMLDDDVLATLHRLELLVKRNPSGARGSGGVYTDTGQKASREWVLLRLARMNRSRLGTLKKHLDILKEFDEVAFDTKGRPYLKHWRRDQCMSRTTSADERTKLRHMDLIPDAARWLVQFPMISANRTVGELCDFLAWRLGKDKHKTIPHVVRLLEDGGYIEVDDGLVSVASSSAASPPRPPPKDAEEQKPKGSGMPSTCRTDIETTAEEEVSYETPIEPIADAPAAATAAPGSASSNAVEGGGRGGEAFFAPVGRHRVQSPAGRSSVGQNRPWKNLHRSRALSGQVYRGWDGKSAPHPRRTLDELREFKIEDMWGCDIIDGLLYLAPDGTPPGDPRFPKGQEGGFKGILKKINEAAGDAAAGEWMIRERVFVDYVEMRERKPGGFDCEAKVIVGLLTELKADLLAGKKTG